MYYGHEHCECCHAHKNPTNSTSGTIRFSADVLETFLRKIHEGFDTSTNVEPTAWREALRIINEGTVEGLMQSKAKSHSEQLLSKLKHSNEVFAAFKVHQMGELMAAKLDDGKGGIKDFHQWKKDVASIASHHVGHWLRTEYDTAVIRAHTAADWVEFERDQDIMPNLRWMPTTSPNPDGGHQMFWERKLTLPVNHPFWKKHYPGNRWNCKCMLEQTDAPISEDLPDGIEQTDKPQRGLDSNPRNGETFSDSHPYFPKSCSQCPFAQKGIKNALTRIFQNRGKKDCVNCHYLLGVINDLKNTADVPPPAVQDYKRYRDGVFVSKYHGKNELEGNERLAEFLQKKLGKNIYLLPRLDPTDPKLSPLRITLLPEGVFTNKNPDFLIGGKLFDGKSMMDFGANTDKYNPKLQKQGIQNRIKKATNQAQNVVLEIPPFIEKKVISNTINGYLKQTSQERIIIVKHGKKCYIYKQK